MIDPVRPIAARATSKQARERIAGTVLRTPLVRLDLGRGGAGHLAQARKSPADQRLQDPRRGQCGRASCRTRSGRAACGRSAPAMPGRASPMRRAQFGIPCYGRRDRDRAADQARPDAGARRDDRPGLLRARPGRRPRRMRSTGSTAPSSIRSTITISSPATARWGSRSSRTLPDVRTVIAAIGGGGLITGVGSAIKALRPDVQVLGAEPETAAPYALSLREGGPRKFPDWQASFVDGAGGQERHRADVAADAAGRRRRDHRHARPDARGDAADRREDADDRRRRGRAGAGRGADRRGRARGRSSASSRAAISTSRKFAELVA